MDRAADWRRPFVVLTCLVMLSLTIGGYTGPGGNVRPAGVSQPFGSDHFGHWITDGSGLPAFDYTADQAADRAARWDDGHGTSTSFWHQLGNDRVVADAFNDGCVELWGRRAAVSFGQLLRRPGAAVRGRVRLPAGRPDGVEHALPGPAARAAYRRVFGMGYYRKDERANRLQADQVIFAPFGTAPVLLSQVVLRNTTGRAETPRMPCSSAR